LVHQIVGTGRRQQDQYRVRENGGYAQTVDMYKVLVAFGTGDMLDAALPDNYNRYRAKDDYINMTALVPLLPDSMYRQTFFNAVGELQTVNASQTFAGKGEKEEKLFGQGDIFKIKSIHVFNKLPHRGYRSLPPLCPSTECCTGGPANGWYGSQGGRVYSNECPVLSDCTPDCSDDEEHYHGSGFDDCGHDDPRNFQIEFEQPHKPAICDGRIPSQPPQTITTQARLVRVPKSKRWYASDCGNKGFGKDVY
jgi:hypothetical protein